MKFRTLSRTNSRGFSFIEQAIAIPVVLLFTLGAIDATNYFRTQNALKEGVHEGLRCLYPTDGDCLRVAAPEHRPVNDLYVPPFFALKHDYDGREEHLRLPDYAFGAISARTLSSVRYPVSATRRGIQRNLYPAQGLVRAVQEIRPGLSGNNPLTTSITNGVTLGVSGSPRGTQFSCLTGGSDEISIGALEFTVPPAPFANQSDLDRIDDKMIFSRIVGTRAATDFNYQEEKANLFFKFNGSGFAYNTRTGQTNQNGQWHGHVEMKVQTFRDGVWRNLQSGASLGGRDFPNLPGQNLVPRGFTRLENSTIFPVDEDGNPGGFRELIIHVETKVPFNSRARVLFTLRGEQGKPCHPDIRVGWDLTSAQIVMSRYEVLEDRPSCVSPQPLSQCSAICAIDRSTSSFYSTLGAKVGPNLQTTCNSNIIAHDDLRTTPSCRADNPDLHTLATSLGVPPHLVGDYSLASSSAANCPTSESSPCPQNFGVTTPSDEDATGVYVSNSSEAQAICPVPSYALPGNTRWYERTDTVHAAPIYARESDCSIRTGMTLPAQMLPPEVAPYKKKFLPQAQLVSTSPSYKFPGDPDELRDLAQFSCSEVSVGRVRFDEDNLNNLPNPMRDLVSQSLFNGVHEQLGCSVEEVLKQEAIRVGMNPGAHFEVTKNSPVPETESQISHTKIDSCVTASADSSLLSTNLRSKVGGGPFFEYTTSPSCVINGINYCIAIPAGVRKVEPDGKYTVDVNNAANRTVEAIEAFMPSGTTDPTCEEGGAANCVTVQFLGNTASESFDPLTDDFHMRASMNLPLLVLGNEPMTIAYEAKRSWEGKYTK